MRKEMMLPALLMTALAWPTGGWALQVAGSAPSGQTAAAPRQSGTVKAVTPHDLVLTNTAGQDVAVTVPATARILLVDPGTRDLKTARPGTMSDIAGGDKAIVTGTVGDTGQSMTATRVLLLKSGAIAALHAEQQAEWAHSLGGLVRSVDSADGTIAAVNGTRALTIKTTPATTYRRYAAGSVRFEDAAPSRLTAIGPGDQVQARGQRAPDGLSLTADEIVSGSFVNVSGVVTAVDPTTNTLTVTDLATKRPVVVSVEPQANLRRLPANYASGLPGHGAGEAGTTPQATRTGASGGNSSSDQRGSAAPTRAGGGRIDLARIVTHLPTETLADLKPGESVIIVASRQAAGADPVAITVVSGVAQILAASPKGETTLSPWSLGSAESEGGEGGEGAGGR